MNAHVLDAPDSCECAECREANTQVFGLTLDHVRRLRRVAKRLYTEQRMDGDQMRDAAHAITAAVDFCKEMPL